jgi:membrane protease YdiL (CAAX protease family)
MVAPTLIVASLIAGCFLHLAGRAGGWVGAPAPHWDIAPAQFFAFTAGSLCLLCAGEWASPLLTAFLLLLVARNGLNFRSGLSPHPTGGWKILSRSFLHYLRAVPILFVTVPLWNLALAALNRLGLEIPLGSQEIVRTLQMHRSSPFALCIALLAVAVVPIGEELLFRGGIYRFLRRYGRGRAAALTALCFSLLHGNWSALLPLYVLGVLLCRVYEREGNLLPVIGMHALFNAGGIAIALLDVTSAVPVPP